MLLFAALAIGLIATGIKAVAAGQDAYQQASDEKAAALQESENYSNLAEQASLNAEIARANAEHALDVGTDTAGRIQKQGITQLGKNIVGQAGSAFSTTSGSAVGLQQEFKAGVQRDINQTLENAQFDYEQAMLEAERFTSEAEGYADQSTFYADRAAGINPFKEGNRAQWLTWLTGNLNAIGTVIGAA